MTFKFSLLLLFILLSKGADSQIEIQGSVMDLNSNTPEFVSVAIQKDSTIIDGVLTDSLGKFNIVVNEIGEYTLLFRSYEFKDTSMTLYLRKDMIVNVTLDFSVEDITGVTVTARIPIVVKKIDRLIFNPAAMLSNAGKSAYDVLKVAPNVTADESGNISIKGISGTGILIDGRLLQMSGEQAMDYLKSIPSDDIYRIEIISNPSSKYDAQGLSGLVNILLKTSQKKGLTGTATVSYAQTTYAKYSGNFNLNYRSEKVNIFGGTSLKSGDFLLTENVDNIYSRSTNPYYYSEIGRRVRRELSSFSKIGADFFPSKNSTIGVRVEHNYNLREGVQNINSSFLQNNATVDSIYTGVNSVKNSNNSFIANLNFNQVLDTLGQEFSLDIDYLNYYQPELSVENTTSRSINSAPLPDIKFSNSASQKIEIYSVKTDYSKPLTKKSWLDVGGKFYSISTGSDLKFFDNVNDSWVQDDTKSNNFDYLEYNAALYAVLYHEFNKKFTAQVGLRNEFVGLTGSNSDSGTVVSQTYNRLFPSVYLNYSKSDNHQFSLSYSNRISRPDYSNLNPFRYYITPNNYIVGDPFLQPAFTNSFDFSYLLKQNFYFSLYANLTQGQISQVLVLEPSTNSYQTLSVNLDNSYNYGFNVYMSLNIAKWWQSSVNLRVGLNGVDTELDGVQYRNENFNAFVSSNNQFMISNKANISAELNAMYQPAGYTQGVFVLGRILNVSASLRKTFANNKTSLVLTFTDILNSAYVGAIIDEVDQYSSIYGNYDNRGIQLTFSYKFGNKNIEKSRDKNSSIKEETERM